MSTKGLVHGPLSQNCVHICVDMQRLFGPGYPWAVPWLEKVLPAIEELCAGHASRTIFTRFIPPARPDERTGTWSRYYHRWASVTLDEAGPETVRLMPALERFVPPAKVFDKIVYSPWSNGEFAWFIKETVTDTVIITGGETDVCVLATALGAIDRGLRAILVVDALCSSSDETHDALMELYSTRFSEQLEAVTLTEIITNWRKSLR